MLITPWLIYETVFCAKPGGAVIASQLCLEGLQKHLWIMALAAIRYADSRRWLGGNNGLVGLARLMQLCKSEGCRVARAPGSASSPSNIAVVKRQRLTHHQTLQMLLLPEGLSEAAQPETGPASIPGEPCTLHRLQY